MGNVIALDASENEHLVKLEFLRSKDFSTVTFQGVN